LYFPQADRKVTLSTERIATRNNHGTGCTLSSAIAAFLAKGADIETAVRDAKAYITNAIRAGADYRLGSGHGPVHHFYRFWK
jgi:hydroxymethylpyrimidine/phosphomethylpyrimidine kinase